MLANCRTYDTYEEPIRLYTLEDAEKIINRRNRIASNKKKKLAIYYLKQKLCGLAMIGVGIVCPMIDGDATVSIAIAFPVGFWLLLTKERVMDFRL